MKSPAERIAGRLIGLAAGDCLGAPIEFGEIRVRPRQEWATEITGGGAFDWRPGQGTDDTDHLGCHKGVLRPSASLPP
jgi:ADP-ribosyl-[dinitrogen reductase] hydrolase